jgi:hypothetical protein
MFQSIRRQNGNKVLMVMEICCWGDKEWQFYDFTEMFALFERREGIKIDSSMSPRRYFHSQITPHNNINNNKKPFFSPLSCPVRAINHIY